jgi:hypothetical protein
MLNYSRFSILHIAMPLLPASRLRRHHSPRLPTHHILRPPQARHRLRLRIKRQPGLPIKRARPTSRHALLVAREAPHGQGNRDRHIHAYLPGFNLAHKPLRRGPRAREDGGAVAVLVGIDERDGVVDGRRVQADEHGAEDFFGVAAHGGSDVGDYCGADLEGR